MVTRASASKPAAAPPRLYLMQVRLAEIEPPIWRRVAVPGPRSLHAFHEILQTTMGWQTYHLYQFEIGGQRYEDPNPDDRDPALPDARGITLDQVGLVQGSRFRYTYDFGDDWHHELTVEGVAPLPTRFLLPVCLGGARAGPPEDCGGVGGLRRARLRGPTAKLGGRSCVSRVVGPGVRSRSAGPRRDQRAAWPARAASQPIRQSQLEARRCLTSAGSCRARLVPGSASR